MSARSLACSSVMPRILPFSSKSRSVCSSRSDLPCNGRFQTRGQISLLEPVEHELGGQEHSDWIDFVLAGVFRRRSMRRFEHGVVIAEVCTRREAESADQAGAQIADDVAK